MVSSDAEFTTYCQWVTTHAVGSLAKASKVLGKPGGPGEVRPSLLLLNDVAEAVEYHLHWFTVMRKRAAERSPALFRRRLPPPDSRRFVASGHDLGQEDTDAYPSPSHTMGHRPWVAARTMAVQHEFSAAAVDAAVGAGQGRIAILHPACYVQDTRCLGSTLHAHQQAHSGGRGHAAEDCATTHLPFEPPPAVALQGASTECQTRYLRQLTSGLVSHLLPDEDAASPAVATVVRELLTTCVLLPAMESLCHPHTLNALLAQQLTAAPASSTPRAAEAAAEAAVHAPDVESALGGGGVAGAPAPMPEGFSDEESDGGTAVYSSAEGRAVGASPFHDVGVSGSMAPEGPGAGIQGEGGAGTVPSMHTPPTSYTISTTPVPAEADFDQGSGDTDAGTQFFYGVMAASQACTLLQGAPPGSFTLRSPPRSATDEAAPADAHIQADVIAVALDGVVLTHVAADGSLRHQPIGVHMQATAGDQPPSSFFCAEAVIKGAPVPAGDVLVIRDGIVHAAGSSTWSHGLPVLGTGSPPGVRGGPALKVVARSPVCGTLAQLLRSCLFDKARYGLAWGSAGGSAVPPLTALYAGEAGAVRTASGPSTPQSGAPCPTPPSPTAAVHGADGEGSMDGWEAVPRPTPVQTESHFTRHMNGTYTRAACVADANSTKHAKTHSSILRYGVGRPASHSTAEAKRPPRERSMSAASGLFNSVLASIGSKAGVLAEELATAETAAACCGATPPVERSALRELLMHGLYQPSLAHSRVVRRRVRADYVRSSDSLLPRLLLRPAAVTLQQRGLLLPRLLPLEVTLTKALILDKRDTALSGPVVVYRFSVAWICPQGVSVPSQVARRMHAALPSSAQSWKVNLRYSALHSLHGRLCKACPRLAGALPFPPKRAGFLGSNLDRSFIAARAQALGSWLEGVMGSTALASSAEMRGALVPGEVLGAVEAAWEIAEAEPLVLEGGATPPPPRGEVGGHHSGGEAQASPLQSSAGDGLGFEHDAVLVAGRPPASAGAGATADVAGGGHSPPRGGGGGAASRSPRRHARQRRGTVSGKELQSLDLNIFGVVSEVFDLPSQSWLRRNAVGVARSMAKLFFHGTAADALKASYSQVMKDEAIAATLRVLRDQLWPDGVWCSEVPGYAEASAAAWTADVQWRDRDALLQAVEESMLTSGLPSILGRECVSQGAHRLVEMLNCPLVLRSLMYTIMDALLSHLFSGLPVHGLSQKAQVMKAWADIGGGTGTSRFFGQDVMSGDMPRASAAAGFFTSGLLSLPSLPFLGRGAPESGAAPTRPSAGPPS